nr:hypothetical protein [Tanacetum cinerariifolium]
DQASGASENESAASLSTGELGDPAADVKA